VQFQSLVIYILFKSDLSKKVRYFQINHSLLIKVVRTRREGSGHIDWRLPRSEGCHDPH
jgi:hypothetical protein